MKRTVLGALAALTLTALTLEPSAYAQSLGNWPASDAAPEWFAPPAAVALTVTDLVGHPIAGAQVLIGEAQDIPFDGNVLTTDQDGRVALPQAWLAAEPVTIEAAGYVRATYLGLMPAVQTLQIRRASESIANTAKRFELKGDSQGFGKLKNDGVFDIGLVVQAVPRAQLSTVNLQSLISPEVDHFTVLGQSVDLPSNITIPDQTESYIFPLHFAKSNYRLYLPQDGSWQIAALHARVPFKSTIDALQKGKSMVDIVNTFDFREGSVTPVTIAQPSTSMDLVVNQMPFTKSISFQAPAYDSGLDLLAISLANAQGSYYPTDIKNVAPSSTVQLAAPAGAQTDGMILAAFKKAGTKTIGAAADQYSAVTLPNSESRPFDPIRLVDPPQVNADQLVLDTPTPTNDLTPVMTYGVLSVVTSITQGHLQMESKQPLWDVWAPSWAMKLDLPKNTPPQVGPNQKLRWEVGFSAQFSGQKSLPPGPGALEKVTHVTRSAVDL